MEIGFISKAWRAMIKRAAETNDAAIYRVKKDLVALLVEQNEKAGQYFAGVNVTLSRLQKYNVSICKRGICRHVFCELSPRFPADVNSFCNKRTSWIE